MIMMWLFLIGFIALNIYLPWRLGDLFALENVVWLYALFAVGTISGFITMSLKTRFNNILISIYHNLAVLWLGIFLFLSLSILVFEVVNLIYRLPPAEAGLAIIIFVAALSIYSLLKALSFKVANVTIPIKNLKSEVKIVQLSDIHLGVTRNKNYLTKIVKKVNDLNPDFVVITGDIVDSKAALAKDMFTPFKDIQSPVYCVYGNHDAYVGLGETIKKLEENNVRVLQNEVLMVNDIKLVGLNYMKADDSVYDPHQITNETIKDTLPTLDLSGDNPKVVLHHGPWGIEYMNENGIDLVLAGHTHGGQLFPFNLMSNTFFPYNKGLAEFKGTQMYVSQGVATYGPVMRLGTDNEINCITLVPQN